MKPKPFSREPAVARKPAERGLPVAELGTT